MGKGAALKTGIRAAAEYFPNDTGIVTADGDGQHLTKDILRVSEELSENPGSLVLGVRDFSGRNVPWRSRFGNRFTSFFFRITNGVRLSDTQTGLRGFSSTLYDTLGEVINNPTTGGNKTKERSVSDIVYIGY